MRNGTLLAVLLVLILLIGIGFFLFNTSSDITVTPSPQTGSTGTTSTTTSPTRPKTMTVIYTGTTFVPNTLNINKEDTVLFLNQSSQGMWVASAPHPTHTDYPEFDQEMTVGNGDSYRFTFQRVGTWRYHNHQNPSAFGSITVE